MNQIDQKLFERIEDYLDGRMSPEEELAFEVKMKAEPELTREVDTERTLRDSITAGAMHDQLEELHEELFGKESSARSERNGLSAWKIAAGIAIILGIGALFFTNGSHEDTLFAEYVTVDPGLPVTMGKNVEYTFSDGMTSYKEGQYQKALNTWETITSNDLNSDKLTYYRACAHFNLEEYVPALSDLAGLVDDAQSEFHDKAVWYTCLSYLQLKQIQQIKSLSPRESSPYYDRVEAIKKELSK